jgi:hypothetical protein
VTRVVLGLADVNQQFRLHDGRSHAARLFAPSPMAPVNISLPRGQPPPAREPARPDHRLQQGRYGQAGDPRLRAGRPARPQPLPGPRHRPLHCPARHRRGRRGHPLPPPATSPPGGLTRGVSNTGERVRLGFISHQGSAHVRWGLIQARATPKRGSLRRGPDPRPAQADARRLGADTGRRSRCRSARTPSRRPRAVIQAEIDALDRAARWRLALKRRPPSHPLRK